ncbi:hypothetical protein QKT49_gp102 [Acanthamoeba castellanii medusavirus]|uniref:Uncharacterized protein n=1 Tax=Acanthamoeba castellanii medusavirus J1 TaxID=3114988 RepID=A0A3T1CWN0_9VIRU|nr:hypothetical protein QKT49_gp102 [Acanthamoeba castellanii medusavirus]BBI30242.1 hypothetical protein [Acanthamoeba castellanii medusavirus J1]
MSYRCQQCGSDLWMLPEGVLTKTPPPARTIQLPIPQEDAEQESLSNKVLTVHADGLSARAIIPAQTSLERLAGLLNGAELRYMSSITRRDFDAVLHERPPDACFPLDCLPDRNTARSLGEIVRYESVMLFLQTTEGVARCFIEGVPRVAFYVAVLRPNKETGRYEHAETHHSGATLYLVMYGIA